MTRDLVFISYRRGDAGAEARALAEELRRAFGEPRVFFDTRSIQGGDDFEICIGQALARASVVLVVMGGGWLSARSANGERRLDDPEDWVHREVSVALGTDGVTVIPVLVEPGLKIPDRANLPAPLASIASRLAMPLHDEQHASHTEQIVERVRALGVAGPDVRPRYQPYPPDLVDELERLTLHRDDGTPEEKSQRRARVTQLAVQLARNPSAGDVVAQARLVSVLGKGNYGTVWHATDIRTGEVRAVKVFDTDRLGLGTSLYHFRRGVRAMRHLEVVAGRPRSIVTLQEAEASALAFSMTYLEGGDLTRVVERGWSLEKKIGLMLQICDAVHVAHQSGIIHRDIKPANIVMHGPDAVLTDFDIADLLFAKTRSSQAAGTVNYSAPEALQGGGERDPRVDVFSLGRLLHFLLIERDPPLGFDEIPRLDDLSAQYPVLARIVRKCTLHDPAQRYPAVAALRAELEAHRLGKRDVGAGISLRPAAETIVRSRTAAMKRWAGVALIASGITGTAALLVLYERRAQPVGGSASSAADAHRPEPTAGTNPTPRSRAESALLNPDRIDAKTGIEFVAIPGGMFLMGSQQGEDPDNERPAHLVMLLPFELGKYPLTNAQYRRFLDANPSASHPLGWTNPSLRDRQPVVGVSWGDALAFASWAGLRLPTEAEREYAARAGTLTQYWSGDTEADLDRVGWFVGNSGRELHDVGEKPANLFGLHDMHGNVWEWCADWYGGYEHDPQSDPSGPTTGSKRVLRGGSWSDSARSAGATRRLALAPAVRGGVGVRLVRGRGADEGR